GIIEVPLSHSGQFPVPKLPDVSLGAPQVGPIDISGASFSLPLNIANKNGFELPVNGLNYSLTVAGQPLLTAGANPGNLPATQRGPVPPSPATAFLRAGLAIATAIRGGAATVGLSGSLDLGGSRLPLTLAPGWGNRVCRPAA